MAHLAALWDLERASHVERYYEAADAAEEAMEREWAAAVTIQRVWRGYATRMQLKHQRDCARKMEEVYRQWNARKKAREAKIAALEQRRRDAYDGAATKLQSLWRGYRSRTDIFDFRSRSAYLAERASDMASMTQKMEDYRESVRANLASEAERRQKEAYAERARREHFMLSTRAQMGVYSSARKKGHPDLKEEDIRAAQPELPPATKRLSEFMRETQRTTHWVIPQAPSTRKKLQGPFKSPSEVWEIRSRPAHRSLRMETPYTHKEDALAEEKQSEWRGRVIDNPFVPVNRLTRSLSKQDMASVRAAEKFVDAPMLSPHAPANRQVTYRRLDKVSRKKDFLNVTRTRPLCDEYGV
eukprot:m.168408 g.168408  ORF g.168408 m.168408 type:complete len:356 (+) comp12950_c0_seq1:311-1378(+)